MNKSITEIEGEVIVVSQFTLHAKTKKGNRPSYIKAARPQQAIPLYERFKENLAIAIGKNGHNIKLASEVTGYTIDAVKKSTDDFISFILSFMLSKMMGKTDMKRL